jgi:hypothetical protein
MAAHLEQDQSERPLAEGLQGGIFPGEKPLESIPAGYSDSDIAPHKTPRGLAQQAILLFNQHLLHPVVEPPAVLGLKPGSSGGLDKPAHCRYTSPFCSNHADVH